MKHCELEGHYVEFDHFLYNSSAKPEGEFSAFWTPSLSPVKFTTNSNCFFEGQNSCPVSVCVWDKTIQTHILPLKSFNSISQNWSNLGFFLYFWQPFGELSCFHAAQLMMGCGARTHQQCKQRVLPGPCCEPSASSVCWAVCMPLLQHLWSTTKITAVAREVTSSRGVEGVGTNPCGRGGRTENASSQHWGSLPWSKAVKLCCLSSQCHGVRDSCALLQSRLMKSVSIAQRCIVPFSAEGAEFPCGP